MEKRADKNPVYNIGNNDKNATMTGAFFGVDHTRIINKIAIVGNERSAETNTAAIFRTGAHAYAATASAAAGRTEIRNALKTRASVEKYAV